MFCGNCGKKLAENAKVCPYCGAPIDKKSLESETIFTESTSAQKKPKRIRKIVIGAVIIAVVGIAAIAVRHNKSEDKYSTHLNEAQAYLGKDAEQSEGQQDADNKQDSQDVKNEELSSKVKEASENSEVIQIESEQENSEEQNKWQEAYIDYLNEKVDDNDDKVKCFLIYIDEDDIPELFIDYGVNAYGKDVCYYDGQQLQTMNVWEPGFGYQKKENLFCASGGRMDVFDDRIYSIVDGKFKLLTEGKYGAEDNSHVEFDENDHPIYRYYWENQEVSEEEYQKKKEQVYNSEKDTSVIAGYTDDIAYSKQEIIDYLRNMISSNLKGTEETDENSDNADQISQECYEPSINGPIDYQILIKNTESGLNVRKEANYDSELVTTITDGTNMIYEGEWKIGPGSDGKNHIWVKVSNGFKGWVRSDLVLVAGRYYQKAGDSVNLRSEPTHDSQLVATIEDSSPMYFYGETEQGYGSDGKMHEWYKVYLGDGISGWVRSDLVKEGEQHG